MYLLFYIRRFQKSVRYKRADNKDAALEKFKLTFQKQRLWNEVLKIEKTSDAQLGRSFEFSLPKEWSRQEQHRPLSQQNTGRQPYDKRALNS